MTNSSPTTDGPTTETDPITVKKYANRRLYNTQNSSYITLEDLASLIRDGQDFRVIDAKSGEDITHSVLTQVILDAETRGETMLPVPFLRQLIALYGDSMQSMVPHYLEASMAAFRKNQEQFRSTLANAFGTQTYSLEDVARQNMAMLEAASAMFTGSGLAPPLPDSPKDSGTTPPQQADDKQEITQLRQQIDLLNKRLETLSQKPGTGKTPARER